MPRKSTVRVGYEVDDNASAQIKGINQEIGQTEVASNIAGAALKAGLVGGAVAAGAAVVGLTKEYAANVKELMRMSTVTGVNIRELGALRYAFEATGFDASDLEAILFELDVKLGDLEDGVPGVAAAYRELGLEVDDLKSKNPAEQFDIILERVKQLDERRQGFVLDTIFGGDDARKVAAIADSIGDLTDEAERLGVTVGDETAAQVEKFNSLMRQAEGAAQGFGQSIAQTAVDVTVSIAETLGVLPQDADKALAGTIRTIEGYEEYLRIAGRQSGAAVGDGFNESLSLGLAEAKTALDRWIIENGGGIIPDSNVPQSDPNYAIQQRINNLATGYGDIPPHLRSPAEQRVSGGRFPAPEAQEILAQLALITQSNATTEAIANALNAVVAGSVGPPPPVDQFNPNTTSDLTGGRPPVGGVNFHDLFPEDERPGFGGSTSGGFSRPGGSNIGGGGDGGGRTIIFAPNFYFNGIIDRDNIVQLTQEAINIGELALNNALAEAGC